MAIRIPDDEMRAAATQRDTDRELLAALMSGGFADFADHLPPRPAWMADALCREYPKVNFYPTSGESPQPALRVCRSCRVQEECLAYALDNGERGVWGGTTQRERRRMRKRARNVA